jgi:hypothetical protein
MLERCSEISGGALLDPGQTGHPQEKCCHWAGTRLSFTHACWPTLLSRCWTVYKHWTCRTEKRLYSLLKERRIV